jgi:hypothetical protein
LICIKRQDDECATMLLICSANAEQGARIECDCGNPRVVEQSQLALYVARGSRLRVQTEQLAQRVNLFLAQGGGFDLPAMALAAPQ